MNFFQEILPVDIKLSDPLCIHQSTRISLLRWRFPMLFLLVFHLLYIFKYYIFIYYKKKQIDKLNQLNEIQIWDLVQIKTLSKCVCSISIQPDRKGEFKIEYFAQMKLLGDCWFYLVRIIIKTLTREKVETINNLAGRVDFKHKIHFYLH